MTIISRFSIGSLTELTILA